MKFMANFSWLLGLVIQFPYALIIVNAFLVGSLEALLALVLPQQCRASLYEDQELHPNKIKVLVTSCEK